jgi:hypothetical protein
MNTRNDFFLSSTKASTPSSSRTETSLPAEGGGVCGSVKL